MNIVRVALAVPLPRFFDYLYSPDLTPIDWWTSIGAFWFAKTSRDRGRFASFFGCSKRKVKTVIDVLDADQLFNSTTWDWLGLSANYYRAALGDVLFQPLP